MTQLTRNLYYSDHVPAARTTIPMAEVRSGFVFAPRYNRSARSDASTFQTCARQFAARVNLSHVFRFDNDGDNDANHTADSTNTRARRSEIIEALDRCSPKLDVVAYFGHGSGTGLTSAGFRAPNVEQFATAISRNAKSRIVVVLYACNAGRVGGFGQELYRLLMSKGTSATVFGHENVGHATRNPYVRRFPGGDLLIQPNSRLWPRWRRGLRESDLWIRFPFMEPHQLRDELQGGANRFSNANRQ